MVHCDVGWKHITLCQNYRRKNIMAIKKKEVVAVHQIEERTINLMIESLEDSPLVPHQFGAKARKHIFATVTKQAKKAGREAKDPRAEAKEAAFIMKSNGGVTRYGVPAYVVKKALAEAAIEVEGLTKVGIGRNIFIKGEPTPHIRVDNLPDGTTIEFQTTYDLIEIQDSDGKPKQPDTIREDVERVSGPSRAPDLRYRYEFRAPWQLRLEIKFRSSKHSAEQIIKLVQEAGHSIGIREHRPGKGGDWGRFRIAEGKVEVF